MLIHLLEDMQVPSLHILWKYARRLFALCIGKNIRKTCEYVCIHDLAHYDYITNVPQSFESATVVQIVR